MSTPPVKPTAAPTLISVTRQPDGSMLFVWQNNAFTGRTYSAITIHQRVGGSTPQINQLTGSAINAQQYQQYVKYGGGAFGVGDPYTFALRAHGPAGSSGLSTERSVPALETPTPTLSSVLRTSQTYAEAALTQNPNPPATVDAVYAYIRKVGAGSWGNSVNRTTSPTQVELGIPLPDGLVAYEVALRSSGPAGWSSDYSTVRTVQPWWETPAPVADLTAVRDPATGDTQLLWAVSSGSARAPRITIEIQRAAGEGQFTRIATIPGTRGGYRDESGVDTRDYTYRVIVHSHAGSAAVDSPKLQATVKIPTAPSNVSAVYQTTGAANRVTSTWTRNASVDRPITGQRIGWQDESADPDDPAAWTWTTIGSTATTSTVTVGANRRVRTTVRASNAAGLSEMAAPSDLVTTTPAGPASLSAGWSGDDIIGTIPAYGTVGDRLVVEFTADGTVWFPLTTLAVEARSFRHPTPTKAVPHTYQAWVESDAVGTPDSAVVTSVPVPGLTKPAPPTVQQPVAVDPSEDIIIPVLHNSLDGSAQTTGEVQVDLAGPLLQMGTDPFAVLPAGSYGAVGDTLTFSARTAGQSGEFSDWSPALSVMLRARPTGVITSPTMVTARTTSTTWTAPGQVSALVELLDSGGSMLASREVGAAVREVDWGDVELEDNGSYSRRLVIRDQYQSSLPIVQAFTVDIVSPSAPSLSARFDPEEASVVADIAGGTGELLELWRLNRDGVWRPVDVGVVAGAQGVASITDPLPPLTVGTYRARAHNTDGGWADSDTVSVDARSCDIHINYGPTLANICRGGWDPTIQINTGRRKVQRHYVEDPTDPTSGDPSIVTGTKLPYRITTSFTIDESTGDTPLPQWEAMSESEDPAVWRDPAGRVIHGTVDDFSADDSSDEQQVVGFTFTRTRQEAQ